MIDLETPIRLTRFDSTIISFRNVGEEEGADRFLRWVGFDHYTDAMLFYLVVA